MHERERERKLTLQFEIKFLFPSPPINHRSDTFSFEEREYYRGLLQVIKGGLRGAGNGKWQLRNIFRKKARKKNAILSPLLLTSTRWPVLLIRVHIMNVFRS